MLYRLSITSTSRRGGPRLVTTLFLLVMASTFAYFVSVGALQPTLPLYVEGPLGGGDVSVGVAIGAFALAAVTLRPLMGRVSDLRGRGVLIAGGAALVAVSVAAYGLASSLWVLVLMRLVTGAGEAAFYVGAASVINDLAPNERRGEALSYFSLALYAGLAVGPVLGETVLSVSRFEIAWVVAAASAATAALLGTRVPDTRPPDVMGTRSAAARLIHPAALVPGIVLACNVWGLAGFTTFVPLYALHLGLDGSRLVFVAYSVIVITIRLLGARIPDRLGVKRATTLALLLQATALMLMAAWDAATGLFVGTALFAVGQAFGFPALMAMAVGAASPSERGAVVGTFTAFFDIAFGLGAVSSGAVAAALGYAGSFAAAAAVAGVGLLILLSRVGVARAAVD